MEKLVKKHKNNLLRKNRTIKRTCNSCKNYACSLDGKCLSSNLVDSAEVFSINNEQENKCFGICETELETRLGNHKMSFKNREKEEKALNFVNMFGTKASLITV